MKLKDIIGSMASKFAALVLTFGLAGGAWGATQVGTGAALKAAAYSGGEIVLTGDIEYDEWLNLTIEGSLELDLAGYTISVPAEAEFSTLFEVSSDGSLTIKGNGTIDASSVEAGDFTAIYNGGSLTIKSGVTIKANLDAELNAYALDCGDDGTTIVENGVVLEGLVWPDGFTLAADGKTVVGKHTVSGGNVVVESAASDPSSGSDPVVAKIGDTEYTSLAAAVAAAQNGDTVTLIANATLSSQFTFSAGKDITLDLAGYTVSGASIANYGTLTIDDSVGNGGITAGAGADAAIVNDDTGIMNIKSGLIDGTATGVNAAVRVYSGAVTIDGGTFRSDTTSGSHYAIQNRGGTLIINDATVDYGFGAVGNWSESTTTINGGTFLPTGRKGSTCHVVYVDGSSTVTVNDGVFRMNYPVDAVPDSGVALASFYNGTVRIYGGSFTAHFTTYAAVELSTGSLIYGGKYSSKTWLANYCAPDYKVTDTADEDGMYAVVSKGVAKIGSTYYQTLAEAVVAAQSGDTLTLLTDVTNTLEKVVLPAGVTFDANGKDYAILFGSGTEADPYLIYNLATFLGFRDDVDFNNNTYSGKYIKLMADIDMSSVDEWIPIGLRNWSDKNVNRRLFSGNFDGNGYTISNLQLTKVVLGERCDNPAKDGMFPAALFGHMYGGEIKNLTLDGVTQKRDETWNPINVGSLVGMLNQSVLIANVVVTNVNLSDWGQSGQRMGGLVGNGLGSPLTVTNCHFYGTLSCPGAAQVGGIVGGGNCVAIDCTVNGTILGNNSVGGIVGFQNSANTPITQCSVDGTVSGGLNVGGIIGSTSGSTTSVTDIENCYVAGTVEGRNALDEGAITVGGLIGHASTSDTVVHSNYCNAAVTVNGAAVARPVLGTYGVAMTDATDLSMFDGNTWNRDIFDMDSAMVYEKNPGEGSASGTIGNDRNNNLVYSASDLEYVETGLVTMVCCSELSDTNAATGINDLGGNYFAVANGDGTVTVGAYAVALISADGTTTNKYETLSAAIADAQAGDTVQLLRDVNLNGTPAVINKSLTLDGDGHSLSTTTSANAINVQTTAAVKIKDLTIPQASRGLGINTHIADPNRGEFHVTVTNVQMVVAQRGITFNAGGTEGSELNVVDCEFRLAGTGDGTPYKNDQHYRGISAWNSPGATFNITDCKIDGFAYDINVAGASGLSTFNIVRTECSGRAMLNVWSSGNTFNVTDCEINGYNWQTGPTEAFGCIVDNEDSQNNTYNINQCRFTANLSQAANSAGGNASQQMFVFRGSGSTVAIRGNTVSYEASIGAEPTDPSGRFGFEVYESHILDNNFYLDTAATNDLETVLAALTTVVPVAVTEGVDGAPVTGVKLVAPVASFVVFSEGERKFATFADAIAAANEAEIDIITILDGTTTSPDSNWKVENGLLVRKVYVAQIVTNDGATTNKYETLTQAVAAASAGATIEVIADDEVSLTNGQEVTINKPLTITGAVDEDGIPVYTIYGTANNTGFNDIFVASSSGTVTISNLGITEFGYEAANSVNGRAPIFVSSGNNNVVLENLYISNFHRTGIKINGGEFLVTNCLIDCSTYMENYRIGGVDVANAATGAFVGTTITDVGTSNPSEWVSAALELIGSGAIRVEDCEFTSAINGIFVSTADHTADGSSAVTVINTTVEANMYSLANDSDAEGALIAVQSGTFTGPLSSETDTGLSISGGFFDRVVPEKYCAENYMPTTTPDENDMYTVVLKGVAKIGDTYYQTFAEAIAVADATLAETGVDPVIMVVDANAEQANPDWKIADGYLVRKVYVAQIGDDKFESLAEAVAAAQDGDTVELIADCAVSEQVSVSKSINIDGNGFTVTSGDDWTGGYVFYVMEEATATAPISCNVSDLKIVSTKHQVVFLLNENENVGNVLNLNNVDIVCDGECIYSNGRATVNAEDCEFKHEGVYATGKDNVYYSALVVGYSGVINATNCVVTSFGNGASTFPSGGKITLVGTEISVTPVEGIPNSGYALWARNEDYDNPAYVEYLSDSIIEVESGIIRGELKITDLYDSGDKNKYAPIIAISGGYFSTAVLAGYCATGYVPTTKPAANGLYTVTTPCTVTYTLAGGDPEGAALPSPAFFAYPSGDMAEIALTPATCTDGGYTFAGWKVSGEGDAISTLPAGTTGNITLVATWTGAQKVTITESTKTAEITVTDAWIAQNVTIEPGASDTDKKTAIENALNTEDKNGLKKWENYVLGLDGSDPNANVAADAAQGPVSATPITSNVDVPPVDTGFKVEYKLVASDTNGTTIAESALQSTPDLTADIAEMTSAGTNVVYYKTVAVITSTDPNKDVTVTVASTNTIGVLKVESGAKTTAVAVPWASYDGTNDISVADIVRTANLTPGDELKAYAPDGSGYKAWTLNESKEWEPNITATKTDSSVAPTADDFKVKRGSAVWLTRADPSQPIYLVGGVAATEKVSVALESKKGDNDPSWNLVGSAGTEPVKVSEIAATTDKIVVPTAYIPKEYEYDAEQGGWGYWDYKTVEKPNGRKTVEKVWKAAEDIPAGTGFWYLNGGDSKDINL